MKYGPLCDPAGTLDVSSVTEGETSLITWLEREGPVVEPPEDQIGFGSKLVERSVLRQLGGTMHHDWSPGGRIATLRVPRNRLIS